jgi:hypothetical protein
MQLIARAPDATVFLSTSALIIGIFLTVVTAALASNLPARLEDLIHPLNRGDYNEWYRKAIRSVLFILIIINTLGTLFPFTLLAINTMAPIEAAWVWVAFSYSICVIFINLGAVSTIFIGPIGARRKLRGSNFNTDNENKGVILNSATSEVGVKAVRYPPTRGARCHAPVGVVLGIAIGLMAAIRFKRQR